MSFRGRLALFFLLIVAIPIAAIGLLVLDVTRDSHSGKADARLSTGLTTALSVYERDVRVAEAAITGIVRNEAMAAALADGDPGAIERTAREVAPEELKWLSVAPPQGEELVVVRSPRPLALQDLRTTGEGGAYRLTASVTGPTEYTDEVSRLTGLDVTLVDSDGAVAGTAAVEGSELPASGESTDVEAQGQTVRAAAGELPEAGGLRVAVLTETEEGGFFDSSPRVAAALAVFLAIALGFILVLFRALQGQIAAMLDAARRIGGGDFSRRVPVVGRDEMAGLATEFNTMSDRLETQIEHLRRQRTELDSMVTRLGEAVASGLDQEALLGIVAEAALGGCSAQYAVVALGDGTVIEREDGATEPARAALRAGQRRATTDGTQVVARRETGHALAAPLERDGRVAGSLAVGREGEAFNLQERDVFVLLLEKAAASIENISEHQRVSEQAATDELTGLPNSRSFREALDREAARAERFKHELSLVILDVDDFKQVNDRFGHLQGDEVLRAIGKILESEPRAIDEPARYGGEEFVVALPETGSEGAIELAERIRVRLEAVRIPSVDGGAPLSVTASFGTATLPGAAGDVRSLFEAADEALYEAKRQGKNRVVTAPVVQPSRQ